jgi:hypothetical protein
MSTPQAAYTNLVNVKSTGTGCGTKNLTRVVPSSAATSLLWQKLNAKTANTASPCGSTMPENANALPAAEVAAIRDWINAGAANN